MKKVTTINLNGKAYSLEEAGYEILKRYLDQAAAKLADNPDKTEIMEDFEQAIAEKCDDHLNERKNVITEKEIEAIIAKMGPVDAGVNGATNSQATHTNSASQSTSGNTPKRLYKIRQGAWLFGVCNGLGAYFNLDTAVVRVLFVLLIAITHGFGTLLYIILAIVMPVARTEEQLEQAHGQTPFNAHDFIEQAKQRYSDFQKNHPHIPRTPGDNYDHEEWRRWKEEMKQWKHEWKTDMRHEKMARRDERRHQNTGGGFLRFFLGLIVAALFILWFISLWSLFAHTMLFGIAFAGYPLWIPILFITALLYVVVLPLKLLIKNTRPQPWNRYSLFSDLVQSIFFIFAIYLLAYTAHILFPAVGQAWSTIVTQLHSM
jgi:phage shock protein PspC (stress-responsive transcriptional regulator)